MIQMDEIGWNFSLTPFLKQALYMSVDDIYNLALQSCREYLSGLSLNSAISKFLE